MTPPAPRPSPLVRIAASALGFVLVVAGALMLILPGPGLLVLVAGLAVLSRHHAWAHGLLRPARAALERTREKARTSLGVTLALVLGSVLIIVTGLLLSLGLGPSVASALLTPLGLSDWSATAEHPAVFTSGVVMSLTGTMALLGSVLGYTLKR